MVKLDQMRVTIGQINTTNGDFEGNVARILSAIEQAKRDWKEHRFPTIPGDETDFTPLPTYS